MSTPSSTALRLPAIYSSSTRQIDSQSAAGAVKNTDGFKDEKLSTLGSACQNKDSFN